MPKDDDGGRLRRIPVALLVAMVAGCAVVQSPSPGVAVRLSPVAPLAVVLPVPVEADSALHSAPAKPTQAQAAADEKPAPVARPIPADNPRKMPVLAPSVALAAPSNPVPAPAAAPAPVAAAPLDLDALRARLKETSAIGLMAKLELRSQVDALVDRFRAHHAGGQPPAIDALRQSFNALVQKVLALIRDGDPALAALLASSREAIWGVLEDPVKFNAAK